jgi:hypothetical protein
VITQILFFLICVSAGTAWTAAIAMRSDKARRTMQVSGALTGVVGLLGVAAGAFLDLSALYTLGMMIQLGLVAGGGLVAFIGLAMIAGSIVALEPRLLSYAKQSSSRAGQMLALGMGLAALATLAWILGTALAGNRLGVLLLFGAMTWWLFAAAVACLAAAWKARHP